MPINLNDWLGDNPWAWWLALAVLLIGAEAVHRGRIALGLAAAAGAGAATAFLAPALGWVQALVAAVTGVACTLLVQRTRGHAAPTASP
jgi:membrane protein implicated in regulation of membrane protease activity